MRILLLEMDRHKRLMDERWVRVKTAMDDNYA
jgi:hypothetical protein